MFIQTEATPNPATLKFVPGKTVMETGVVDFPDATSAEASPLAARLFDIDDVTAVFFGSDFITITKGDTEWQHLKPAVLGAIMEHFTSGRPLLNASANTVEASAMADDDDEVVVQIKELIETRVRPAVAQDGGDIVYHGFSDGIVYLQMRGACAGCPSAAITLKNGIENMMRHYIPEVEEVRSV
jgi:Fe-S cluster biogenesis protein NfuA